MTDYDNTNRGVLFQEQDKKTDKSPDYTGKLDVNGKEYRLAGWKQLGKSGKPFLSLIISEPQKKEQSGYDTFKQAGEAVKAKQDTPVSNEEMDSLISSGEPINLDDIPF